MLEIFNEIWSTLRQNKLRTALTGFAVSWGLFILIALLGAGNGLLNALTSNSGDIMSNSMKIWPGFRSIPYEGMKENSPIEFTDKDVEFLGGERFRGTVEGAGGGISYTDTLVFGKESSPVAVYGVSPLKKEIDNQKVLLGRYLNDKDISEYRKSAVVDRGLASNMTGDDWKSMLGKHVRLGDIAYRVVGIVEKDEQSGGNPEVLLPISTVSRIRSKGNYLDEMFLSFRGLDTKKDNETFENSLRHSMNFRHRAAPEDESTIYIWNRMNSNLAMGKAIRIMNIALWILGMFTLLSGIVGVSNIMLITVRERIHEFGIRKALGATPWSIMNLIVVESIIITSFFGYVGMVCGLLANYLMDITIANNPIDIGITQVYMFKDPSVGLDVAVEATVLIIAAGTLAGLIPALKAARVRPVEALSKD